MTKDKIFESCDPLKGALDKDDEEESASGDVCLLQTSDIRDRRDSNKHLGRTKTPRLQRTPKTPRTNGG